MKKYFTQELVDNTARTAVEGTFEVVFYSAGGILLASAHLVNRYLCKTCPACEPEGVN